MADSLTTLGISAVRLATVIYYLVDAKKKILTQNQYMNNDVMVCKVVTKDVLSSLNTYVDFISN